VSSRRAVSLIGARGAGKTTVGRLVAERLGLAFVDLDAETLRWGRRVGEAAETTGALLERVGLGRFRILEAEALRRLLEPSQALVLAAGGGSIVRADACHWLRSATHVIWLRAPAGVLGARIARDPTPRPALEGEDASAEVPAVLARREPLYRALATGIVESGEGTPAEVASRVVSQLQALDPSFEGAGG